MGRDGWGNEGSTLDVGICSGPAVEPVGRSEPAPKRSSAVCEALIAARPSIFVSC